MIVLMATFVAMRSVDVVVFEGEFGYCLSLMDKSGKEERLITTTNWDHVYEGFVAAFGTPYRPGQQSALWWYVFMRV